MYDYGTYDYGYSTESAVGALGAFAVIFLIIGIIALGIVIFQTIAYWKMYKKAGKGGWESIVPYYCNYVLVEIAGLNWWWFLFFFAPLVLSVLGLTWLGTLASTFVSFNCFYNISKRFNKGVGFAICFTLFTPICAAILAFSKKEVYNANIPVSPNGIFGNPETPKNQPAQSMNQPIQNNYQQPVQPMEQPVAPTVEQPMEQPVQQAGPKFCTVCGNPVVDNAKFCTKCGNQL